MADLEGRERISRSPKPGLAKTAVSHYCECDALGLAKEWIIVSGRRIKSEDDMRTQIEHICTARFGMRRRRESLRAKWATLQRESYV